MDNSNLMAKVAAAQLLPLIFQLVQTQPVQDSLTQQGKKFDYAGLFEEAFELMQGTNGQQ